MICVKPLKMPRFFDFFWISKFGEIHAKNRAKTFRTIREKFSNAASRGALLREKLELKCKKPDPGEGSGSLSSSNCSGRGASRAAFVYFWVFSTTKLRWVVFPPA